MQGRPLRGWMGAVAGLLLVPITASGHIEFQATLDTAQEVDPSPTGTNPGEGGTATFSLDEESGQLSFTVTLHDLTGDPIAAHLHRGAPGVAGPIVVSLDASKFRGETGSVLFGNDLVPDLLAGNLYVNYHTVANQLGEVRGQVLLVPGACACAAFPNHGQFVKCVKKAIKALDQSDRKDANIKRLKKAVAKSSCGKKKGPKKAIACCVPLNAEGNVVTESLCLPVKENACAGKGGTSKGAGSSCFPTNPCSPSGAFLDADTLF